MPDKRPPLQRARAILDSTEAQTPAEFIAKAHAYATLALAETTAELLVLLEPILDHLAGTPDLETDPWLMPVVTAASQAPRGVVDVDLPTPIGCGSYVVLDHVVNVRNPFAAGRGQPEWVQRTRIECERDDGHPGLHERETLTGVETWDDAGRTMNHPGATRPPETVTERCDWTDPDLNRCLRGEGHPGLHHPDTPPMRPITPKP